MNSLFSASNALLIALFSSAMVNAAYAQDSNPSADNNPPVVKEIPGESINEGGKFATIKLDDYVSDDHDAASLITWSVSGNIKLKVTISADRVATIETPDQYWNGYEEITFIATDTQGASGSKSAFFNVESVNNPPVVAQIPDQTIDEDKLFAKIKLDDYVKDPDHRKEQLEWEFDIQPNGRDQADGDLTVEIDDKRVATIVIPDKDWYGSAKIKFTATDPEYASDSKIAIFTVKPINDAPVLSQIPGQTIEEKLEFESITLTDYVTDVDDDVSKIKWTVTGGKELKIDINRYGVASITIPNEYWHGSETFAFTATDPAGASTSTKVTFTVKSVNDEPEFTQDIPDQTIDEKEEFDVVELKKCISDPDHTFEQLKWTYTGTTDLKVVLNGTTATIWIPNRLWNGSETITFRATDPEGAYAESTATFTVKSVNDLPTFVKAIPNQSVEVGTQFSKIYLDGYVKDADHKLNEMTWKASVEHQGTLPAEGTITVDIDINRIAYINIPSADWTGSAIVKFTCTDPEGASINQEVTLSVTAAAVIPTAIKDLPNQQKTDRIIKTIENGQIVIIRNGVKYNLAGQKL